MADEIQKPKEIQSEKKGQLPVLPVLCAVMVAGSFLASFLTAKFMAPQQAVDVKQAKNTDGSEKPNEIKDKTKEKTTFYKLGEFIVNLANKESTRYLKTDITMEIVEVKEIDKILKEKESMYRDAILEKIASYTTQQLSNAEGKKSMKQDILTSITGLDPDIKVANIYFNSLMMQ
jgi:flagellar basal body-associated protein FliL